MNEIFTEDEINFSALFYYLWEKKYCILFFSGFCGCIALIISLLLPRQWTSESVFVGSSQSNSQIGSLAGMANLIGISTLGDPSSKEALYEHIIFSHDFLRPLAQKKWETDSGKEKSLAELFSIHFKRLPNANRLADSTYQLELACIKKLQSRIKYSRDIKTKVITLKITLPDPIVSLRIHQAILSSLQEYNSQDAISRARKERIFMEHQLRNYEKELEQAENRLAQFNKRNITINNPDLLLEQSRLMRNVQINIGLVAEFKKQVELAKLQEEKERQFIEIIQAPLIPVSPSHPQRLKIISIGLLAGFLCGCIYVFAKLLKTSIS